MATQPLSDDVLNDTSGFNDTPAEPKQAPTEEKEPLQLTDDQALDDSHADPESGTEDGEKQENPVEKRIKGALKARDEARNEAANEKARAAELERRLAAIEARMSPEQSEAPAAQETPAPNPEDYEFGALDQKYIDDLVDYRAQLSVKKALGELETQFQTQQEQVAQQQAAQQQLEVAKDIVAKGAALYDDFEEVVWERGLREEYKLDRPTFEALADPDTKHAADIAYALAKDPAEAARVASLSPIQQARYVFEKDKEFAGSKQSRTTQAPEPPGTATRGSSGRFTVAPDTEDLDAFEKEFFKKK